MRKVALAGTELHCERVCGLPAKPLTHSHTLARCFPSDSRVGRSCASNLVPASRREGRNGSGRRRALHLASSRGKDRGVVHWNERAGTDERNQKCDAYLSTEETEEVARESAHSQCAVPNEGFGPVPG